MSHEQISLFDPPEALPHGLIYRPNFLTVDEERYLLEAFAQIPFAPAQFGQYVARRRVVRYSDGEYPHDAGPRAQGDNHPPSPLPGFLLPLRSKVADWLGIAEREFVHVLCTEYPPRAPIGWHSDAPHFETIVGLSLAGKARMRFRPYVAKNDKAAIALDLERRSAYVMQGDIRWRWQHHIPPTQELRYSITFRTLRAEPLPERPPR